MQASTKKSRLARERQNNVETRLPSLSLPCQWHWRALKLRERDEKGSRDSDLRHWERRRGGGGGDHDTKTTKRLLLAPRVVKQRLGRAEPGRTPRQSRETSRNQLGCRPETSCTFVFFPFLLRPAKRVPSVVRLKQLSPSFAFEERRKERFTFVVERVVKFGQKRREWQTTLNEEEVSRRACLL